MLNSITVVIKHSGFRAVRDYFLLGDGEKDGTCFEARII